MTTVNIVDYGSIDFALRVIESIAFSSLSILGITEPCTGYLRGLFPERCYDDIPIWFWPVCGILFAMVAVANFSSNNTIVLVIQFLSIAHHHFASGFEPGVFVIIGCGVVSIRMDSLFLTLSGTCGIIAILILVKKPSSSSSAAAAAASREIDYGYSM